MSATADIETRTVRNAVAVPIQSVTVRDRTGMTADQLEEAKEKEQHERSGNDIEVAASKEEAKRDLDKLLKVVFIKEGEKVRLQKVETGIADNSMIEIKSGVKPGDVIVSGSYAAISRQLKDGSKVRIEKPKPDVPAAN
jgi:HlyD family secretion protein